MEKFDCSAVKETKAPLPHPRPQFSKHKSAEQQATNIKAYKSYSSSESCVQLVVGVAETWGGGAQPPVLFPQVTASSRSCSCSQGPATGDQTHGVSR